MTTEGAIAVVGMACRYPGAADVREYWACLRDGVEGIARFDPAELVAAGADPALVRREEFVPAMGTLAGSRSFDWRFFGYSRAEAAIIDPQHRVFLECASAALDDAALDPVRFPGWIGVYGGAEGPVADSAHTDPFQQLIGQRQDFLTTRVAYKLGMRGPAVTVQTACSTSLTAVHMAVQGLLAYECDAALAGGASVVPLSERGYLYQEGGILSPDGHCRPFDRHSAGTVPGEGVGIVVLRRLEDALADGDRIAAVIRGSAINNDGGDKIGYTAPAVAGQRDAIMLAQKVADVDPADIDYVEAHGTGTRIGDPVELQALTDAFRTAGAEPGRCWIGSVKGNIGHTGSAAGVAGLIKVVAMLEQGELAPTLHYSAPNPLLEIERTPFRVCAHRQPWPESGAGLAAVSSFGVGGTNAHVVLGPSPGGPVGRAGGHRSAGPHVFALSGASAEGLARLRTRMAEHLTSEAFERTRAGDPAAEAARSLACRRALAVRQTFVASDVAEAAESMRAASGRGPSRPVERVALLFPGQGTLTPGVGAAAHELLDGFAASFDEFASGVRERQGIDLSPVVRGGPEEWALNTVHQQLGLLALGWALGRQVLDWGLTPEAMLGNSIGEYVAATLAGSWSAADAADLVHERARAMEATEPGRMVAVDADAAEVAAVVKGRPDIAVAVVGPGRVVLSGRSAAVDALLDEDLLAGMRTRALETSRAFHSPAMAPAADALRAAVTATPAVAPELRFVSNVTGGWTEPEQVCSADYWAEQLRGTVQLEDGLATVLGTDCDTFLELGPGTSMTAALRRHRNWSAERHALPVLGSGDSARRTLLTTLGTLWERGADIDLERLSARSAPAKISLPTYPFESRDPARDRGVQAKVPVTGPVTGAAKVLSRRAEQARPTAVRHELERLWCETLGVESVTDPDDFFALGGESLMAVGLMGRVRERLHSTVTVAEFTGAPTFGGLVALVEQAGTTPVHTAPPLHPGRGRPVFLFADALETGSSYRVVAGLLRVDRPVYGLEPQGPPCRGLPRIEDIAREYVEAVLRTQPEGPYTVGGWSFGAVVAHEVARQLVARGGEVDTLVCLDGHAPDQGGLPVGADPRFLGGIVRGQLGAVLGVGPVARQTRRATELRKRYVVNTAGLLRYRPRPVPCRAVLLPATPDVQAAERLRHEVAALYTDVEVHPVPGDHWTMLTRPHAEVLARHLDSALSERPQDEDGDL